MASMPEDTFFIMFSTWLPKSRLSSMVTPSDLAVETLVTGKSSIANVGKTVIELNNLCQNPINIISVLVIIVIANFCSYTEE